jgi:hypothetical protein
MSRRLESLVLSWDCQEVSHLNYDPLYTRLLRELWFPLSLYVDFFNPWLVPHCPTVRVFGLTWNKWFGVWWKKQDLLYPSLCSPCFLLSFLTRFYSVLTCFVYKLQISINLLYLSNTLLLSIVRKCTLSPPPGFYKKLDLPFLSEKVAEHLVIWGEDGGGSRKVTNLTDYFKILCSRT